MSDETLIQVEGIGKKYCRSLNRSLVYGIRDMASSLIGRKAPAEQLRDDEFWAVDDLSFEVKAGECLGLIGPNGAGKSTVLKMLNGIMLPDKGRITVRGRVGALIELGAGFHPALTGRENVYINGAILGLSKTEIDRKFDAIVAFAELEEFIDSPVKFYSTGMYVRLGFAVAAHLVREILLVDEILAVGDVAFRLKCFNHVQHLIENGAAVVLVTHNLTDVARVCNAGLALYKGRDLASHGLADAVRRYQEVMQRAMAQPPRNRNTPVRFFSAQTRNSTGAVSKTFRSGDDLLLDIFYDSSVAAPDSLFIIKVTSQELGEFVSFTNRVSSQKIPISVGRGKVSVRLRNLPLLAGNYGLQVHLYDALTSTFWDRAVPACTFDIVEPVPEVWKEFHTLRIEHDWIINP